MNHKRQPTEDERDHATLLFAGERGSGVKHDGRAHCSCSLAQLIRNVRGTPQPKTEEAGGD